MWRHWSGSSALMKFLSREASLMRFEWWWLYFQPPFTTLRSIVLQVGQNEMVFMFPPTPYTDTDTLLCQKWSIKRKRFPDFWGKAEIYMQTMEPSASNRSGWVEQKKSIRKHTSSHESGKYLTLELKSRNPTFPGMCRATGLAPFFTWSQEIRWPWDISSSHCPIVPCAVQWLHIFLKKRVTLGLNQSRNPFVQILHLHLQIIYQIKFPCCKPNFPLMHSIKFTGWYSYVHANFHTADVLLRDPYPKLIDLKIERDKIKVEQLIGIRE